MFFNHIVPRKNTLIFIFIFSHRYTCTRSLQSFVFFKYFYRHLRTLKNKNEYSLGVVHLEGPGECGRSYAFQNLSFLML